VSKTYVPVRLRRTVAERTGNCCAYCLQPEIFAFCPHEIDHIIAEKHGGETLEGNLTLACKLCNTFKGSDVASVDPETGEIVRLYQPGRDRWSDHFRLDGAEMVPLTAIARTTVWLLDVNRRERLEERSLWLVSGLVDWLNES
jgi:hypothetical protein